MSHKFESAEQRVSYGIGRQLGDQLAQNPFEGLDPASVAEGVVDSLNNAEPQVPVAELEAAFELVRTKMQKADNDKYSDQIEAGKKFLEENAKKEGVTITESGLQYEVLNEGEGDIPAATSTVRTHYHGTLIDGKVFDSSYDRGEPAEFPVNGVIPGWTEALQLMKVGAKYRLSIPSNLAYGERGAGAHIPPYTTLVFDVELLAIVS